MKAFGIVIFWVMVTGIYIGLAGVLFYNLAQAKIDAPYAEEM